MNNLQLLRDLDRCELDGQRADVGGEDAVGPPGKTPLHRQLSTVLRASLTDGRLPAGSQLATEAELQEKFGISRSFARHS